MEAIGNTIFKWNEKMMGMGQLANTGWNGYRLAISLVGNISYFGNRVVSLQFHSPR